MKYGKEEPNQIYFKQIKKTEIPIVFVVAKTDTFAFPDETDWIKK
jgi:hypothetical protein